MQFEWDEDKNQENIKKHGLSFQDAATVFLDPMRIEMLDESHSTLEEERFITVGMAGSVITVVYTERKSNTRIITARKATKEEERRYLNGYS